MESELERAGGPIQGQLDMASIWGNATDSVTLRMPDLGPVTYSLLDEAIQPQQQWQGKAHVGDKMGKSYVLPVTCQLPSTGRG